MSDYIIDVKAQQPPQNVSELISDFKNKIETLELKNKHPLVVFQDGKSGAYYIDCHISSSSVNNLLDYQASLDPDEQEEFKANRDLLPFHKAFLAMQEDAKKGRQFNDIIVEYLPKGSKAEKPLKIYGGQHRAKSIEETTNTTDRYHGFRVYFDLNSTQRNEIARVSNTNINVPLDLIDRMNETVIGPGLRNWCQTVGFLQKGDDFAERKNPEGIITVRLARAFVVNFRHGKEMKANIDDKAYTSLWGDEVNDEYLKLQSTERAKLLNNKNLIEAARNYVALHKKQMEIVKKDQVLSQTAEFKTKAMTPAIISSWAIVAGLLQKNKSRLDKLYQLVKASGNKDPLAAKEMSEYKHHDYDPKTYRGLGTRSDKKERGKLVQLFLLYSDPASQSTRIDTRLIDAAVTDYHAKFLEQESKKKKARIMKGG